LDFFTAGRILLQIVAADAGGVAVDERRTAYGSVASASVLGLGV
jgi:hypothetical protein